MPDNPTTGENKSAAVAKFRLRSSTKFPNTYYTSLAGAGSLRWEMTETGDWESSPGRIPQSTTEACPVGRVPDILRRAICEAYSESRELLPERMSHYSLFATHRVRLTCPACGGSGKIDQGRPLLEGNKCGECAGAGSTPCQCVECDERAAGLRSQTFYTGAGCQEEGGGGLPAEAGE